VYTNKLINMGNEFQKKIMLPLPTQYDEDINEIIFLDGRTLGSLHL
jgi:hypothetical protein